MEKVRSHTYLFYTLVAQFVERGVYLSTGKMSGRWANVDKKDEDRFNEIDVLGASSVSMVTMIKMDPNSSLI